MDELSAHFGFRSEECVQKLQYFLESGQLEGVMDDRGKFIYIGDEEFEAGRKSFVYLQILYGEQQITQILLSKTIKMR